MSVVKVMPEALPVIDLPEPFRVTPAAEAVNVPVFNQLPEAVMSPVPWVMAPEPVRSPVKFTMVLLVLSAVVLPTAQSPAIVRVPVAVVLVPAPENVRFL